MPAEQKENNKSWYLIHSKPHKERSAEENLKRQGYQTYLPLISQKRRHRSKDIVSIEPLFPRYLFIHLDTTQDNWSPIRSTIGVSSIVSFDHTPAKVPDLLVSAFINNENEHRVQCMLKSRLKSGDAVQITDGPMQHYQGILMAFTSKERVIILLDMLGEQSRLVLPASYIAPVSA